MTELSSTSAGELKALSTQREVIYAIIPFQNYAPNLAKPTYSTEEVNSQKFFTPTLRNKAQISGSSSSAQLLSIGKAAKWLLPFECWHSLQMSYAGILTQAWVLMGVLEKAAEDKVKDVDSLIHTLPQDLCQLCQVLLNVLLQETHRVVHWWLDNVLQWLKSQKRQGWASPITSSSSTSHAQLQCH